MAISPSASITINDTQRSFRLIVKRRERWQDELFETMFGTITLEKGAMAHKKRIGMAERASGGNASRNLGATLKLRCA